jgi:hypothetical protein
VGQYFAVVAEEDGAPAEAEARAPPLVTAHQVPPLTFRCWPLAWPGAVSPVYVYTGQPATVSCLVPSDRVIEPSSDWAKPCAIGLADPAGTGGQIAAQLLVQCEVGGEAESASKR